MKITLEESIFAVAIADALALAAAIVGALALTSAHLQKPATPAPSSVPAGMAWVPGGKFLMGSDHELAQDNERPAHGAKVDGFWMDRHHVTNAEFRKFVEATGYVTTASHGAADSEADAQADHRAGREPDVDLQSLQRELFGEQPASLAPR